MIENDIKCEMPGCFNVGSITDSDGVAKCQACLARELLKTIQKKRIKTQRNDPCPCNSGQKFKKCCGELGNLLKQWYLRRVGRVIYYDTAIKLKNPSEDDLNALENGILIKDITHARMLYEYTTENGIHFADEKISKLQA